MLFNGIENGLDTLNKYGKNIKEDLIKLFLEGIPILSEEYDHEEQLDADDPDDVVDVINDVLNSDYLVVKKGANGRVAYYDPITNTLVISDPNNIDGGTVFRPGDPDYIYNSFE